MHIGIRVSQTIQTHYNLYGTYFYSTHLCDGLGCALLDRGLGLCGRSSRPDPLFCTFGIPLRDGGLTPGIFSVLLGGLGMGLVDIGLVGETARLSNTLSILEAERSDDLGSVLCRTRGERIVGRIRRMKGVFSGLVGDFGPVGIISVTRMKEKCKQVFNMSSHDWLTCNTLAGEWCRSSTTGERGSQ